MTHHIHTRLAHIGSGKFDPDTGVAPVSVPTVRTSTVRFKDTATYDAVMRRKGEGERIPSYGRQGMDTHEALQDAINALEGGSRCFLVPSGMAAVSLAFMALLSPGEHVLVSDSAYAPVRTLDANLLQRLNIEVTYFSPGKDDLESLIRPNTRVLYVETPGSLLYEMLDLPKLAEVARRRDLVLVADNTWGSGYLYQPLALGAQVSVIAATKYIAGHSDVMMGAVVVSDPELAARIHRTNYALGMTVGADDASLALRGVRTMPVRIAQHGRNALEVCEFLQKHPDVDRVFCPALPSDPGHALWARDCTGTNGMIAISLAHATNAQARVFVDTLEFFGIGFSWGGFESLVQLVEPGLVAGHTYWNGNPRQLIRLHIGLEAPADLINDLGRALAAMGTGAGEAAVA